jgi:hypothetical protein
MPAAHGERRSDVGLDRARNTPNRSLRRRMSTPTQPPEYKGAPLDGERGPGLGCFWIQVALLTFFLILTPLTVTWAWPPIVSAALLFFTLILLLFTGQTVIFLLRLVAADRRTRRTPLDPQAKPTVGQMEDQAGTGPEPASNQPTSSPSDVADSPASGPEPNNDGDDR